MSYYKRHLPHWQPEGAEFFITFRLAGTLPSEAIEKLKLYRKQLQNEDNLTEQDRIRNIIFKKYEQQLDNAEAGPNWLEKEEIAHVVQGALYYYDEEAYDLYAYCVMPNHVHMVFRHFVTSEGDQENDYPITNILQSIKSYSALECNKLLNRKGKFWQSESFDRVIRDQDELENVIRYTLYNSVKAGLIKKWKNWPYSYCKPEFVEEFESK
jgi:REP element-mobilizing transposase RayT